VTNDPAGAGGGIAAEGGVAAAIRPGQAGGTAVVRAEHLAIAYRRPDGSEVQAVRDVTFSVRPGEFVTLIGPSGCGKTSVLRCLGGLLQPAAGEVQVNGSPVRQPRPDEIAYVFQDFALFPWRTARENVEIALQLKGVRRAERRQRSLDALRSVGLGNVADGDVQDRV
jgi:NitT/TauT family transport system ATP-binding protein